MTIDTAARMQWERLKGELRAFVIAVRSQDDDEDDSDEIASNVETLIDDVEDRIDED